MTSCPWLNAHVAPCVRDAAEKVETAVDDLREEVRAEPVKTLVIAGLAGFVLGVAISAVRR